jgi:hypothetical protein
MPISPARTRTKACQVCGLAAKTLFRVQYAATQGWVFVCGPSRQRLEVANPFYVYGGTWKANKRH